LLYNIIFLNKNKCLDTFNLSLFIYILKQQYVARYERICKECKIYIDFDIKASNDLKTKIKRNIRSLLDKYPNDRFLISFMANGSKRSFELNVGSYEFVLSENDLEESIKSRIDINYNDFDNI
jgi:hypothetical protein